MRRSGTALALALALGAGASCPRPGRAAPPLEDAAEPEPTPQGLVELAPAPAEEPAPAPLRIELAEEPEPAPLGLVELAPAPTEEPAPAALAEEALAAALPAEPEAEEPAPAEEPASHRRHRSAEERRAARHEARLAQSESVCGPGAPPIEGFTVDGHRFSPRWLDLTLHGVIANRCQSKTYGDIEALDGGTVGISHFAVGSLLTLYRHMEQRRYFGAHAGHVPDRPYALTWWREGMRRFLRSPESRRAQQLAWREYISPALQSALRHGWRTDRELAIAASIANSLGAYGFQQFCDQNGWQAERALRSYALLSDHKERRRQRLDREFPPGGATGAPNS